MRDLGRRRRVWVRGGHERRGGLYLASGRAESVRWSSYPEKRGGKLRLEDPPRGSRGLLRPVGSVMTGWSRVEIAQSVCRARDTTTAQWGRRVSVGRPRVKREAEPWAPGVGAPGSGSCVRGAEKEVAIIRVPRTSEMTRRNVGE